MAKVKPHKINLIYQDQKNQIEYQCPVAEKAYLGACPVTTCPANISARRTNASGCYYEHGKPNLIDVSRWNGLTTQDTKRYYESGMATISKFIVFYNYILDVRNNPKKHCPKCGVENKGELCLNGKRCNRRHKLYLANMQRFPFNVTALNVSPYEFLTCCTNDNLIECLPKNIHKKVELLLKNRIYDGKR